VIAQVVPAGGAPTSLRPDRGAEHGAFTLPGSARHDFRFRVMGEGDALTTHFIRPGGVLDAQEELVAP